MRQHGQGGGRLRLSQPTVSEVIAELEHTFGVRLLDRSPQGVAPKVYGDALLRRSIAAFDELRQSSRDIAFLADPAVGELRIGCQGSVAVTVMPPVVRRFSELYPRVVIHVDELPSPASQRRRCEIENAIWSWQGLSPHSRRRRGLECGSPLRGTTLVVVAGAQSQWARRRKVDLAELIDEPWLLGRRNHGFTRILRRLSAPAGSTCRRLLW